MYSFSSGLKNTTNISVASTILSGHLSGPPKGGPNFMVAVWKAPCVGSLTRALHLHHLAAEIRCRRSRKQAIAQRDSLLGGWDRVVVPGWNVEPSIGAPITALNDDRLEMLVIPPDLMGRLKKKGGREKLRGTVRFSSPQYQTIWPVARANSQASLAREAAP